MAALFRNSSKASRRELKTSAKLARAAIADPYSPEALALGERTNESVRSMFGLPDGTIDFHALVLDMLEGAPTHDLAFVADHSRVNEFTNEYVYELEFAKHWDSRNETEREAELIKLVKFQNSSRHVVPDVPGEDPPYEFLISLALLGAKITCISTAFDAQYDSDFSLRHSQDPEQFGFHEYGSSDQVGERESAETVAPGATTNLMDDEELQEALHDDRVRLEREAARSLIALKDAMGADSETFENYLSEREQGGESIDELDGALIGAALILEAEIGLSDLEPAGDIVLFSCIDAAMVFAYTLARSFERKDRIAHEDLTRRFSRPESGVDALRALQWVYLADFVSHAVDEDDDAEAQEQIELLSSGSHLKTGQMNDIKGLVSEWGVAEEAIVLDSAGVSESPNDLDDALAVVEKHAFFFLCDTLNLGEHRPMYMSAGSGVVMDSLIGGYLQRLESSDQLHELNPDLTPGG